jgi:hypothetical protein
MENVFSKARRFVARLQKSLNLISKFSAKESIISIVQTLGKGTITDPSSQSKQQEEK